MSDGTPIIIKKVKGHGGHGHHGGSWKVAYADFVTAMMAFFMVMWIMGLSDDTRAQIQGYFNDPLGFKKNMQRTKNVIAPKTSPGQRPSKSQSASSNGNQTIQIKDSDRLKTLQGKLKGMLSNDAKLRGLLHNVEITMTQEGLRIELVESTDAAFFESGSKYLNPAAQRLVKEIAPVLRQQDRTLIVEGHTDSVPYPDPKYTNWDLSGDRANELRRALFSAGVNPRRLAGMRALADTELKIPSDPTNPRNRRVTILLPYKADAADGSGTKMPKDQLPTSPFTGKHDVVLAPKFTH